MQNSSKGALLLNVKVKMFLVTQLQDLQIMLKWGRDI